MGLDMYLNKRTYVGANYEHNNVLGKIELTKGDQNKPIPIQLNRVVEIVEQFGYWRKANHIHNWFVENVQSGKDDCGDYDLTKEDLEKLLQDCREVLEQKDLAIAQEKLPTRSGFFFGGTDYDEYYFSDVEDTIKIIEPLLVDYTTGYYYTSSW